VVVPIQRWNVLVDMPVFQIESTRRLYDSRFRSADSQVVIYDCHYSYISHTLVVEVDSHLSQKLVKYVAMSC
jgi:hypothetical protein